MTRLFDAGFVERFRPQTLRGSYQWTYCLAREGFQAAEQTGNVPVGLKFAPRRERVFDYRYVLHDLRVNEWVLRYRDLLGERLLDWAGPDESRYEPPKPRAGETYRDLAADIMFDTGWNASNLNKQFFRPVQPDAVLDVAGPERDVPVFVEYDRTRRVDKNYDKFLRYEALVTCWWRTTDLVCPIVVFVCQDDAHRLRFLRAADNELDASIFRWTDSGREDRYIARHRIYFALESDIRQGDTAAIRLPTWPRDNEQRTDSNLRRVVLPGIE
jgi:hypothetical protein